MVYTGCWTGVLIVGACLLTALLLVELARWQFGVDTLREPEQHRVERADDGEQIAGVEGIVNFAPVTLSLPPHVQIVAVDLAIELEQLSFAVTTKLKKPAAEPQPPHPHQSHQPQQ